MTRRICCVCGIEHAPPIDDGRDEVIVAVGTEPGVVGLATADAALAVGGTPAEFARFISTEQQRWKAVVARAKITPPAVPMPPRKP